MVGQMGQRRQLQPGQRDMIGIEIDGDDLCRLGGQIIEDVAAARGDGDQPVMGLKLQRLQIHAGIFPDLVIDKALKHQGKKPLQRASAAGGRGLMGGPFQKHVGHVVLSLPARSRDIAMNRALRDITPLVNHFMKGIGHLHDGLAKAPKHDCSRP